MDDIFLFAPDEIKLAENTKRVLARLQENDLFLKPTKCEFNKTRVEYLGMVIGEGKISMLGNYVEFETGRLQPLLRKLEDFWALETFIDNLFDISQTWQSL